MKKPMLLALSLCITQILICQQCESLIISNDTVPKIKTENTKKDLRPIKDRIAFGFGSSFWITPSQTYFELVPLLVYHFPKTLTTGIGYRFIYPHQRLTDKNLNAYGPNVFARINLLKRVYLWTEYEILANEYLVETAGQEEAIS